MTHPLVSGNDTDLERLLDDWAMRPHHRAKGFVRDGVIDWQKWTGASRKVLFLLREAYGKPGTTEAWDLRSMIRDDWGGPKHGIWHRVSQWAYAIHHSEVTSMPLLTPPLIPAEEAQRSLLSSAFVNIKKSAGSSSSTWEDLHAYFANDRELLKRQIELLTPDFIVFGGTWALVKELWSAAKPIQDRVWNLGAGTAIDFWHPANRFPNTLNYYAFAYLSWIAVRSRHSISNPARDYQLPSSKD